MHRVFAPGAQRALGRADKHIEQHALLLQRRDRAVGLGRRAGGIQRHGLAQHLVLVHAHAAVGDAAAAGLALADAVPVILDHDALAVRGNRGEASLAAFGILPGNRQEVGNMRARGEGAIAVQHEPLPVAPAKQAVGKAVGGIAPEPVALD
ncbi:hypothetical protein ACU4GD_30700 [Cupriavidus basilensis]